MFSFFALPTYRLWTLANVALRLPRITSLHYPWPLTWNRTSWLIRWLSFSLPGSDTTDKRFFSAKDRSLMNSSRLGRPSCWASRDWSWARSMEPNRIMDSVSTDRERRRERRRGAKRGRKRKRKTSRMSSQQETPRSCYSTAESSAQLHNKGTECSECILGSLRVCWGGVRWWWGGSSHALSNCLCYSTCWLCIWLNAAANCSCARL